MRKARWALLALASWLSLPLRGGAETVDLNIFRYCAPGQFCAHASLAAYDDFVCKVVEEMNVVWEATGISFRPLVQPVDSTSPADSTGLPLNKQKYYQTSGCADGEDNDAIRTHWRENVAMADKSKLSLMLTKGTNRCCSGIPRTWKDLDIAHGIFCDAHPSRTVRGQGTLWAHEMGHHWSLAHTHGGCADTADGENPQGDADSGVAYGCDIEHEGCETDADCTEGGSCVPDGLPQVTDTPADRCRFEVCSATCQNDPGESACASDADCDPGEGPCACPGADENLEGNILDDHTWFASPGSERLIVPAVDDLSYGSPHYSWCPADIRTRVNGITLTSETSPPTEDTVRNSMSYHGAFCRGPYVLLGDRFEGFSDEQLDRIAACRDDIYPRDPAHLPDVCAGSGGDGDHDGICDDDDNCPGVRNTCQTNSDLDLQGDACDCPGAQSNDDTDGDGIPDACDADIDGDGCYNAPSEDDHPDDAQMYESTTIHIGCGVDSETRWVSDVADTDGDGTINCKDPDDDDDGLCDAPGPGCSTVGDECPEIPGELCTIFASGEPCPPVWTFCGLDCVIQFLKIVEVINPDPTHELVFERIAIVNRTIFASPLAGLTAGESVNAIGEQLAGGVTLARGSERPAAGAIARAAAHAATAGEPQRVRLELWERGSGPRGDRLLAVIGEYDASQLRLGELVRGGLVRFAPTFDVTGAPRLEVDATYGVGIRSPEALDRDADGTPDLLDNCLLAGNRLQQDSDRDGYGNRCDADLDQDGAVDEEDLAQVGRCAGADLALELPILEPALFDGENLGEPADEPDPVAATMSAACLGADLDEDVDVDAADARLAEDALGEAPGPSALVRGFPLPPAPAPAASCVDGAAIEGARLTLAGLDLEPGAQRLRLRGELALPAVQVNPARQGIALAIRDAAANTLFDVTIPGGADWSTRRTGDVTRHEYHGSAAGLDSLVVEVGAAGVETRVMGNGVDATPTIPTLPLLWEVSFAPQAVATSACGETDFGTGGGGPTCRAIQGGAHVECR